MARTTRLIWLLLAILAVPAFADDVYLTNGESFEGVLAVEHGTQVKIRLPGGQVSLPLSMVERIERAPSAYQRFLDRRRELARTDADAAEWLALAERAYRDELLHNARETALIAAELDPGLEGLAPLLERFDYVLDPEIGRWITFERHMERRGMTRYGNRWLTHSEAAELRRVEREVAERRREEWTASRLAAIAERLERDRRTERGDTVVVVPPVVVATAIPFVVFADPGAAPPAPLDPASPAPPRRIQPPPRIPTPTPEQLSPAPVFDFMDLQPGSLFQGRLDLSGRGR